MKYRLRSAILALVVTVAQWSLLFLDDVKAAEWDATDKVLFGSFVALQVADAAQTRYASHHPERFREANPLLGSQPSDGKIIAIKSLLVGGSYYLLRDADSQTRKSALVILDGLYIGIVAHNAAIGVRMRF